MNNQRNRPQALDYEELRKQRGTGQAESVETARLFADPISYYYNKLQDHKYMRDDYWTEAAKRSESELLISLLELSKDTPNEDLDDLIENYSGHLDYDNYMTALNIPFLDDTDQSRKARLNEDVFDEEGNLISEGDGYDFGTFTDREWAREIMKYTTGKWEAMDIELAKEMQSFWKKLGVWWLRQHGGVPGNLASGALKFLGDVYNISEGLLNMMFNWTNDANVETRFLAAFDDDETTNPLGNLADFMQNWNYEFQRKHTGLVNAVEAHEQGYRLGEGNFIQSITDATNMGAGMNTRGRWFNGVTQAIGYMLPTVALAYFSGGSSLAISAETGLISTSIGGSMLAGASAARSLVFYTGIFGGMMKDTVEQAKAQGISYKDLNAGQVMRNAALKSAVQYAIEVALGAILGFTASDTLMGVGKGAGVFAKAGAEAGTELGKQAMATGWKAMKPVLTSMAKDALQEGLEEVSQDLSDMAINWAFDKLGNGTYQYSEDFDWQGLMDSFATGMLSSIIMGNMHNLIMDVQQKAAVRKGQADFSNLATYDADGNLVKLNYFQRINMREAMETINNWSETANDPNAKFDDKIKAVASLNAALAVFGEYYASIGVERATKSDAILKEMVEQDTKRHKIEALQKASSYTKELMMDFMKANNAAGINYLTEKNQKDILKGMDEKTRELVEAMVTKIESAITNELNPDDPNTPIPKDAVVRLQSALKSLGVDVIVGLDGDIVTKSDNVIFVNNEIVKNGDVESIVKGITRKLAIEEVSKALNNSQKKMILKQYNQFDSKGTLDDAVSALMFDKSFYTYILLASRETRKPYSTTAFNMLATIDQILQQALAGKVDKGVITNKALSKLLTKVQDNMRQGLVNFATQYQNIDIDRISEEIIPADIKKVIREHKNVAFTKLVNDSIASKVRPSNDRITEYNEIIDKLDNILKPDVIKSLKENYASIDYNKRVDATIALVFLLRYQTGVDLKLTYLPTDGSSIPTRLAIKTLNESLGVDYKAFIEGRFDPSKLAAPGKDFNTFGMYDTETRAGRLGMVRDILFRQSNQTLTIGTNGELMEVINKSDMVKTKYLGKQGDANLVQDIKDGKVKTIQDISTIKLDNRVGRLNLVIDSSMLDENKTVKRNGYYITGDNKIVVSHVNTVNGIMHELTHATQYYTQVGLAEGSMLTAGGDTDIFRILPPKVNANLTQYVKENFPVSYALFKENNNDVVQLLYFSLEGELQANANISALLFETGFTWKQVGRNQRAILVSPDGTREWSMTPDARKTRKSTTEASQKIGEKSKPTGDLESPMEKTLKQAFINGEITNAEKDAKQKVSNSEELKLSEENKLKRTKELYEAFQKVNPKISNFEFKPLSTSIGALYDPKSNKIIINSLSDRAGTSRLSHELVHSLEGTKGYNELLEYTKKFLQRANMYESMAKEVRKAYTDAKLLEGMTKAQIDKYIDQEVLAQFSESLFTDQAVIFNFVKANRNLATKILDWIKGLWAKLTGKLKPSEQSFKNELKRIEQMYLQALKNYDPAKPRTNLDAKFMWVGDNSQEAKKIQTNPEFGKMSNYDMAMFMKAGNFTLDEIRQRTGWTLDKSGYWKYEIADDKMELKIPFKQLQQMAINGMRINSNLDKATQHYIATGKINATPMIPLGDIIKHDILFEHYPHLKSFLIKLEYNPSDKNTNGIYHYNYISINMATLIDGAIANQVEDTIQNTILHEIQHEVQYFEGWPNGADHEVLQETLDNEIKFKLEAESKQYRRWNAQFFMELNKILNTYAFTNATTKLMSEYLRSQESMGQLADMVANRLAVNDIEANTKSKSDLDYEIQADTILDTLNDLWFEIKAAEVEYFEKNGYKSGVQLYLDTLGEMEARHTGERWKLNEQQRQAEWKAMPEHSTKGIIWADNKSVLKSIESSYSFDSKVNNDEKLNVKNPATFNGKSFWIGTVNLSDGTIESTYTYEQAQKTDFHHTMYFSQAQIEKVSNGENAIFWVSPEGKIQGEWRDKIPRNILARIQEQIDIPEKGTKVLKPGVLISSENMTPDATPEDYGKLLYKINNSEEINYNVDWKNADPINENWSQDKLNWAYKYVPILLADKLAIRFYTPLEHARLMGVRDADFNKLSIDQSDTALYRLAGNSIVVNVLQHLFDGLYEQKILTKPVKLIEMFAGYGSQALALKYLNADFESHKIIEWAHDAIVAYDNLHNDTSIDHSKDLSRNEVIDFLVSKNVASPSQQSPLSRRGISTLGEAKLRRIYNAIINSNNLVDIMATKGSDLEIGDTKVNDYVVTYSFPCQDLSNAGLKAGIKEGTRSGLLLQVERILNELPKKQLPKVLIMENVPQIHNQNNSPAFNRWIEALTKLGYTNEYTDMKASNYGIPQSRNRTFMVSILGDTSYKFPGHIPLTTKVTDLLQPTSNIDSKYFLTEAGFKLFAGIDNDTRQSTDTKMEINRDMARTLLTSRTEQARDGNFQSDVLRRNFDLQKLVKPSTPQELSETIRLINMLTDTGSAISFDEELNSRTFSNKFANESNLKYWIKKGVRAQADPKIQQFVIATTGKDFNKLPDVIKTKIYNGSLTLNDIKHFIATSANTNTYTHQMIAKHVYQNTELSKLKTADLKVLTDNLQQIAILKYMLNDDVVIEKMTPKDMVKLVADINELAETDKDLGIKLANAYRLVTKEAYERRKQHIPIELDLKQIAPILYNHYDGTIESVATVEKILSHQMYRQEKKLHEMRENLEKTGRGEVVDPTTVGENETQTSSTKVYKWLDNLKQTDVEYLYQNATEAYSNIDPIEMANVLEKSVTDSILAKYAGLSRDELAKRRNAIMTELNKQLDVIREMSNAQLAVAYDQFMNAEIEGRNMDPREIEGIVEIDMKEPPSLKNLKDLLRKRATNVIDRVGKVKGRYDLLSDVTKANIDPKTYTLKPDYQNMTREEVIQLSNALSNDMKMLRTIHKSQDSKAKRAEQIERRLKKLAAQEVKVKERIQTLKEQQKTMRDKVRRNFSEKVKNTDAVFKSNVEANAFVKQLLATQWEKTRKSKVQGLTENTIRNVHNGKVFFETNANTFLNMDVSDAEATARWFMEAAISNISRNSMEAQAFEAIRLYTLGHIYSQSAADGMFEGFNANLRQSIYNALHNLAIGNATGLAVWSNIQGLINPLERMMQSEMIMGGVIISDNEKAKIADAIATNNYNTLQQTINEIINRVNLEKPPKKGILRKVSAVRSLFMLSGPLTWLRLQVSKRSLRGLNKLSSKIGNMIVPSNTKPGQVKLTGKVTTEIQSYITHHFLDSGLFDTVINNISRYNPSSIKAKYRDATGLAHKDAILHQLVIKSMYNQYYNENLFKTKWMNQVHAGLMKVLTDNNIVRETAIRYFGKMLAERGYNLTSKDANGNITFNEVNDVVMNDFASALGLAMADYMHSENVFSQIETVLANKSDSALFAFKLVLPFAKAQWNWFKAMIKYSPVGLVQSLVKFSRLETAIRKAETAWANNKSHLHPDLVEYQIRRDMGSGAIGTMGIMLGLMLAGLGYIDLEDEDYGTPKLRVGNLRIDISSIFGSTSILAGAAIIKGWENADSNKLMASINAMLDPVLDGFFLTQIMALDKYSYDGFGSTTVSIAEQTILSFIPNLFKYIANASYAGKPQANTFYYKAAKSIPLLNQVVPKKVNPYTGQDTDMWQIFNSMVPYFEVRTGSVTEEKSKALGVNKVQLRGNYEINGEKFKLSPVQAAELNKMYGQWNADVLTMFYSSKSSHTVKMPDGTFRTLRYNQMSEVQRQNAVHNIFNKNSEYAKIYAWIKAGNKYYASESDYIALRKLGITKGLYKGNKGYIKG